MLSGNALLVCVPLCLPLDLDLAYKQPWWMGRVFTNHLFNILRHVYAKGSTHVMTAKKRQMETDLFCLSVGDECIIYSDPRRHLWPETGIRVCRFLFRYGENDGRHKLLSCNTVQVNHSLCPRELASQERLLSFRVLHLQALLKAFHQLTLLKVLQFQVSLCVLHLLISLKMCYMYFCCS